MGARYTWLARGRWTGLLIVSLCLGALSTLASHIVGGDVSMQAVGTTPGLFRVELKQYWDETQTSSGNRDNFVTILVFRKNNPQLIDTFRLNFREAVPLTFSNEACATLRRLEFTEARYYANYQFDPARYTDPGGYYMVWERCCRNQELTNVNSSLALGGAAMTFYLEFPAMSRGGRPFANSAPNFVLPNGSYVCLNKPFTFSVGATDADGDQLRYSLVTPLNGYTTADSPNITTTAPRASYPTINWAPGYSLANIIPGNPPLTINPTTGLLTLNATQEGLFLFTVQCEEFRNGERIGVVRRDFQLPVIDCSKNTPPPAVVTVNGKTVSSISICGTQTVLLSAEKNPAWAYQWQKDGINIRGATSDTLRVRESGEYAVVKSQAKVCGNDTLSQVIHVTITSRPTMQIRASAPGLCTGDSVLITLDGQPGYRYQWQRDNSILPDTSSRLLARQGGIYQATATGPAGCTAISEKLTLTQIETPKALFDSIAPVCNSIGAVPLNGQPAGGSFSGPGVSGSQFNPAVAGPGTHKLTYTATTANGCRSAQSRLAVVATPATISGQTEYRITRGSTVQLLTQASQPIGQYRWGPPATLSQADVASPVAHPDITTPYQLTAISTAGCTTTFAVLVDVVQPLYIPSAFSPNADGMNDSWVIQNISQFPQCEVVIYNRWGEVVFYSRGYTQPWTGLYRQEPVPPGVFTYHINTNAGKLAATYRGQLVVIR